MAAGRYTRQLATIVSIDASGFSVLMGSDDEAALAAFEERRAVIIERCTAFGGRMFGDAGDSIMAEFGSPVAALLAAFEFQQRISDLNGRSKPDQSLAFRAGINTGDVIAHNGRLYGDDVNIAARIQELAPGDGLAISETTWHHVRSKVAAEFGDLGELPLKNIKLPVRVLIARRSKTSNGGPAPSQVNHHPPAAHSGKHDGGRPTLAVLPFVSEDADLGYMAEGIADDIARGLASTRWLSVIAKNSSFQFRDEALNFRQIGTALGARYLVSGTLSRHKGHLRVSPALTDTTSGRLVWSRHLERPISEVIDLQNEIGGEIVSTLEKEVDRIEQARTFQVPWENLETWQLVLRGRWHMSRHTSRDTELALDQFEQALAKAPNSSWVFNELSWWWFWRAWLRFGDSSDLEKSADFARKALLIDSQDARPHANLGAVEIMRGRPARAAEYFRTAIHLNPSYAFAHSGMGSANLLLGDAQASLPFFRDAERLSPYDTYSFHNLGELAAAYCLLGDWPTAIATADRSLDLSPAYFYARFLKIGALVRSGRLEEGRSEMAIFRTRHPDFTPMRVRWIPFAERTIIENLLANFMAAGWPDTN
jgi:adenylate cyclase